MHFIDSHCHLDLAPFDTDRNAAMQRAVSAKVTDIIIPAVTAERWQNLHQLCSDYDHLHPAYGLHPMFMQQHTLAHLDQLEIMLQQKDAIAVGECGLDFFYQTQLSNDEKKWQEAIFTHQFSLAEQYQLPVIIHSRKSLDLVLKEIRKRSSVSGVIHSFSGSEQQAHQLIDNGFYLGFGGPITYTRAKKLRRLVARLPLDALLLETDAPDQPDACHYGQRNEPAWLPVIADTIAELRGISVEEVAHTTSNNAVRLFNLHKMNSVQ